MSHDQSPRRRILMTSYACRPNQGSEPGMGWNRAVQAARDFDTWVLCEGTRSEPAIRAHVAQHGDIPGLQFIYVPQTRFLRTLARVPGLFYLAYNLWHRRALKVAQQLHEDIEFDLVHQVTYCGYREPGYTWKLSAPFVWGPVGGTHNYPWGFLPQAGLFGALSEGFRSIANNVQFRCGRRIHQVARQAAIAFAGNSTTQRHFRDAVGVEMPLMPASGINTVLGEPRAFRQDTTLRLLWCGYLHPLKGLPLVLRALAKLPHDFRYTLRIVGEGPYRRKWQRLAAKLGIADRLEWTGLIPHREALQQYQWADALVFSSLRDTFPTVVLESLAAGLPVICLDHLGMGDIVTPQCGVKVPLTTPKDVIAGLTRAIAGIGNDARRWEQLSRGAIERAQRYTWSQQADELARYYRQIMRPQQDTEGESLSDDESLSSDRSVAGCRN